MAFELPPLPYPKNALEPYTSAALEALGKSGTRRVDVFCPGFTSDCLETIEEIGIEVRDDFLKAGGKEFHRIPCLNASPAWIKALGEIVGVDSTEELLGRIFARFCIGK